MLINVLIVIALIVLILAIVIALRPGSYRYTRTARLAAPPSVVFPYVNDFTRWPAWSPWQKIDPAIQYTYTGPASGKGAGVHWLGNKKAGEGRMTITESIPNERIVTSVEFIKPFPSLCEQEFTFAPDGGGTLVTWSMGGKSNFMMKAMGLFTDVDKMIGKDFEEGLANLEVGTKGGR